MSNPTSTSSGSSSNGSSSSSSSSSRNEYYLGGIIALLLQDHCTMSPNQFVAASTWWQISTKRQAHR